MDAEYIDDDCNMQPATVYQVEKSAILSEPKSSKIWKNVEIQPRYCHDFAAVCLDFIKCGKIKACKEKLKQHLLYLGWKIEFKNDGIMRFRYFSPGGKLYYSLCQVCSYLMATEHKDTRPEIDNEKALTDVSVPSFTSSKCLVDINRKRKKLSTNKLTKHREFEWAPTSKLNSVVSLEANAAKAQVMDAEYIDDDCDMQLGTVYQVEKIVNLSGSKSSKIWKKVEIQPEYYHGFAVVCLDFVKYGDSKACKEVIQKLKKHLLYLGWKIEFKYDGIMRFRYFSPDGKLYYSLSQVCSNMMVTGRKDTFPEIDYEQVFTHVSVPTVTTDSESFLDSGTSLDGNAIINYVEYIEKSQGKKDKVLTENAKNYLKQSGWDLHMKQRKKKQELEYTAPNGKNYRSLYTACKAFCEEKHSNTAIISKKIVKKVQLNEASSVIKKNGRPKNASLLTACKTLCVEHSNAITKSNKIMKKVPLNEDSSEIKKNGRKRKREGGKSKRLLIAASTNYQHDRKNILSWLLQKEIILPRQKVSYIHEKDGRVMKKGIVTPDGIKCRCCSMLFSPAKFQAHAGSDTSQSASRIYLSDGKSLLQCQIEAINSNKCNYMSHVRSKRDYSNYECDFLCSICCDGGNILICDHCPSAFHPECVGLKEIPEGSWYCPSCKCHLCGKSEFKELNYNVEELLEKSILYCDQCERGYHVGCFREKEPPLLSSCSTGSWFCSQDCSKINDYLEKILGKRNYTSENDITWTILRSKHRNEDNFDVETIAEYHSKLNVASDVLHECFETFIEPRTQSDIVSDMLFNRASELRRLNFWGVYTVILEREDEIISVATLRVFGNYVAEMPLIGTRFRYRELGMCRLLVTEIEKMLTEVGVKMFVLPAAPSVLRTWIESFEFIQMTTSDRMNLLGFNLLNFQDAFMCYKHLNRVSNPSHVSEEKDECHQSPTNACASRSDEEILIFQNNNVIAHQMFRRNLMHVSSNNSYEESKPVQSNNVRSLSNASEETKVCHQSSTNVNTNDFYQESTATEIIENSNEINVALSFLTSVCCLTR